MAAEPGRPPWVLDLTSPSCETIVQSPRTAEQEDPGLDPVVRVARALAGELALDDLLRHVVQVARDATGARYAALGVIGEDQGLARFVHVGMDDRQVAAIGHLPTGRGVLGLLIRHPQTLCLERLSDHAASSGFPEHHPPMETFLGTPIRSRGAVFGNLYLTDKAGGFTARDQKFVEVLAVQVGVAVDNALMAEQLQQLAVQAERERISRDLHDGIIQTLFSIGMGLDSARSMVGFDPERVATRIDSAIDAIDTAIRDLRNTIFRLRADDAAALGLRAGLVELAREHEVNALTRPRLVVPDRVDAVVPARLVADVLQVVREALGNVAKHAQASEVTVSLDCDDEVLELLVADDGRGFDPDQLTAGHGLANMRERATLYGGSLHVDAAPGAGAALRLTLPLHDDLPHPPIPPIDEVPR